MTLPAVFLRLLQASIVPKQGRDSFAGLLDEATGSLVPRSPPASSRTWGKIPVEPVSM